MSALLTLALSLAPALGGSGATIPQTPAGVQEEGEKKEVKHLEKWPKVVEETVEVDVERLRKARTTGMGEQAREALIEAGAGVVPYLLPKLGLERDEAAQQRIVEVLDAVTGAEHTRLLAKHFADRKAPVRRWTLRRVALFPDAGVRDQAEQAYAKANKKKKRDRDEDEIFAAALCATSAGSFVGFDEIAKRAEKKWSENGHAIHVALTAVRSSEATKRVAPILAEDSRGRKVAAMRLLAACGEGDEATRLVAPLLDSSDNSLRVGAINALRGIVDGDPPLDRLPVFEAIERASKWKARL